MSDVAKYPGLIQRESGVFGFRKTVPADVREIAGKGAIITSLNTKDRGEAVDRYHVQAAKASKQINEWRALAYGQPLASATPPKDHLTKQAVSGLCETHRETFVRADFHERVKLTARAASDDKAFWSGSVFEFPDTDRFRHLMEEPDPDHVVGYLLRHRHRTRLKALRRDLFLGDCGDHLATADDLLKHSGLNVVGADRDWLAGRLIAAEIKAIEQIIENYPDALDDAPGVAAPSVTMPAAKVGTAPLASISLQEWFAEKSGRSWTDGSEKAVRVMLNDFLAIVGDKPLDTYGKADGRKFKQVISKLPPSVRKLKALKELSLVDAAKKAHADGVKPMSVRSINKRMTNVGGFFNWAANNYDAVIINPVSGMAVENSKSAQDERDPFTPNELKAIFSAPVYTGCKSEARWSLPGDVMLQDTGRFWVPLISLMTGMRLGEVVQLYVTDVQSDNGVLFFDLCKGGSGNEEKRFKNTTAIRRIPIHQNLIDLGLMNFVKIRRDDKSLRLFPGWERQPTKQSWSDRFSRYFTRFLIKRDIKHDRICFHSFRHTFQDAARNAGVDTAVLEAIQGHKSAGQAGRYGTQHALPILDAALQGITFDVDLEHLKLSG